jgi:lipoprotein-anchoring transpeptidase ErfK/SrfK
MRLLILGCLAAIVCAVPAVAQEPAPEPPPPPPEPRIAAGVKAGGVDLGGLTLAEATDRLRQRLGPRLRRPVVVHATGRRWTLRPAAVRFRWNPRRTAKDALAAPRGARVALRARFSRRAIGSFVTGVARAVHRPARNARVRFTVRRMVRVGARKGRKLNSGRARSLIRTAFADPTARRNLWPGWHALRPRVRVRDLRRMHPTVITVHRAGFRLRLFKRLRLVRSYGIAVGAVGYATPTGTYRIQNKAKNPAWHAPNKPWAGLYAGRTVPGGAPDNPLKARWLGIVNGVGIHGTAAEYSIGSRASHGCIRMRVRDVKHLYRRVPVGTPVYIR